MGIKRVSYIQREVLLEKKKKKNWGKNLLPIG